MVEVALMDAPLPTVTSDEGEPKWHFFLVLREAHGGIKIASAHPRGLSTLDIQTRRRPLVEKERATTKPNARRMTNGSEGASKIVVTLARDGSWKKRRAEKLEWFGGSKTSQGASGDSPTYVFERARVTAQ